MNADAALGEARDHFRNNDFGYSAALYKKVVELSPKDPQGYIGLGASYDRLGRFDLSDRVYATLYAITGETAQYDNNLGYSYMLRGNLTQALVSFRKAKALAPDSAVVANNLQILDQRDQASVRPLSLMVEDPPDRRDDGDGDDRRDNNRDRRPLPEGEPVSLGAGRISGHRSLAVALRRARRSACRGR